MRVALFVLALAAAGLTLGCGGGSSSTHTNLISLREFMFDPAQTTVPVGTEVQWTNLGSVTHSVVSGSLLTTQTPVTTNISVQDSQFSMTTIGLTLGDMLLFTNRATQSAQIQVRDQNNHVVFLSAILAQNQTATWQTINPGRFTLANLLNPLAQATVDVVGIPQADGRFSSPILAPGDRFRFTFTAPGTYTYYCGVHFEESGTIIVTP